MNDTRISPDDPRAVAATTRYLTKKLKEARMHARKDRWHQAHNALRYTVRGVEEWQTMYVGNFDGEDLYSNLNALNADINAVRPLLHELLQLTQAAAKPTANTLARDLPTAVTCSELANLYLQRLRDQEAWSMEIATL